MIAIARRAIALVLSCAFAGTMVALPSIPAAASVAGPLYTLHLPDGRTARVYANGIAEITSKDRKELQFRRFNVGSKLHDVFAGSRLPDKKRLIAALMQPQHRLPYAPSRVVVVLRQGVNVAGDLVTVTSPKNFATTRYTTDFQLNRTMAALGVDRIQRLYQHVNRSELSAMVSATQSASGHTILDIANVYRVGVTKTSVRSAVLQLLKSPDVLYASPDWYVSPMHTEATPLSSADLAQARVRAQQMQMNSFAEDTVLKRPGIPTNYALASSMQSMHNATNDDSAAAFDEIWSKYHQLPGEGETITNVSLGDLDDASAINNPNDPCEFYASFNGVTTEVVGGQRYLNLPSMPLIPTYTADDSGVLNGKGEVCGVDTFLSEPDLDFAMMAPLPHQDQRPSERGDGATDLLGIAPGAKYRLIVPASGEPTYTDIQAAILAAAMQTPRPDVITTSLGYGFDEEGFPGRFLEDDPLTESIVASIVSAFNIVVCVSANDGMRIFSNTAIGPSGGSAATDTAAPGSPITVLSDLEYSGAPSHDYDSGSIDAGAATLDDIFSNPPQYAKSALVQAQHAYPETRYSGYANFSSGNGTRVNVSAAGDNVIGFEHALGGADDSVYVVNEGGTSAAAPEAAAAAAIALQIARLTGHPFKNAAAVRTLLEQTANALPANGQTGETLNVGPQIDVRRMVETLLTRAGDAGKPAVPRVAVEQRRNAGQFDGQFASDTNPQDIDLHSNDNANLLSWITIAPDWEWMPKGTTYRLSVAGKPGVVLATTPWARMLPATLFEKAGLAASSTSARSLKLEYYALDGRRVLAHVPVSLKFSATGTTTASALAPDVPLEVTGSTIPVTYDISHVDDVSSPQLVVSYPGRFNPSNFSPFNYLAVPLSKLSGTVKIPVSKLHGGGIYGIGITYNSTTGASTDFNFVRVAPAGSSVARPLPPTLSGYGLENVHDLTIPYDGTFDVHWSVRDVKGANGGIVEISAPGPAGNGVYNPFNNPEGSIVDKDGVDSGSVYSVTVSGQSGTVRIKAAKAGMSSTFSHTVRVIPMKNGTAAGQASDVSTVSEGGLASADGGSVSSGFAVNSNGTDGYLTSNQPTLNGGEESSLETISTKTMSVTGITSAQSSGPCCTNPILTYQTYGEGIYGNDIGLFDINGFSFSGITNAYTLLNPVTSVVLGATWTPPVSSSFQLQGVAPNQSTTTAVFYGMTPPAASGPTTWQLFTSDLSANTFGTVYDITAPISSEGEPQYEAMAENPTTNQAWLVTEDESQGCVAPSLVDVDLATGSTSSFTGVGSGWSYGMAIDPTNNVGAVTTACDDGLGIYNLASKTATNVLLPGAGVNGGQPGYYLTVDPVNHLFLVAQLYGGDAFTNCNALGHLLVYDEKGNLVEDKEDFNWAPMGIRMQLNGVQIVPGSRTGLTFSQKTDELEPFTY